MNHIILTADQVRIALGAEKPIEVRDEQGRTVAHLTPLHPGDVEAIEQSKRSRGAGGPRVPSEQVQAHFQRLDEARLQSGLEENQMLEMLRRLRAGEQG